MNDKGQPTLQQIYRRRRVVLVVGAVFSALIALGLFNIGKFAVNSFNALKNNEKQQQIAASKASDNAEEGGLIPECAAGDLSVQVDMPKEAFSPQEGLHLLVRTTYLGQTKCAVKTATDNRILRVQFDNKDFYNSQNCPVEDAGVVLAKGEVSTQEVTWNMRATGDDFCSSGDLAIPGYYTAQLVFAVPSGLATNPITFRVTG